MTAIQVEIRNHLKSIVDAAKPSYVITDFDTESTYFPQEKIEDLSAKPKAKFIAIGFASSRDRLVRNSAKIEVEVPVQIAVQQSLSSVASMDLLVELVEQIMATCETDYAVSTGHSFSWLRTEPMKDENGLTYSYEQLKTAGVFQSIFTPIYKHIKN